MTDDEIRAEVVRLNAEVHAGKRPSPMPHLDEALKKAADDVYRETMRTVPRQGGKLRQSIQLERDGKDGYRILTPLASPVLPSDSPFQAGEALVEKFPQVSGQDLSGTSEDVVRRRLADQLARATAGRDLDMKPPARDDCTCDWMLRAATARWEQLVVDAACPEHGGL